MVTADPHGTLEREAIVRPAMADLSRDDDGLCAAPADCNIFAERWFLDAGLIHCRSGDYEEPLIVRDAKGAAIGRFPMGDIGKLGRLPLPCARLWSHPNAFLTAASASAGREAEAWVRLIERLHAGGAARALLVDGLVEGSCMHRGLIDASTQFGLPFATEARIVRAMLATSLDPEAYWQEAVRAKKRKELRRQWARLADEGSVVACAAQDDPAWIDEFLMLEAGGWKGRNGSALLSHASTQGFFRAAMLGAMERSQIVVTALHLDGRPIAMLITLIGLGARGRAGFSFKTAFDERYARFSPGVLLQRESIGLLASHGLDFIDSCAAQDHPMIDGLWRERRTVLSLSLPLPGARNRLAWGAAQASARMWRRVRGRARKDQAR